MNKQRRKIWELEDRFHCSVVGTCLGLDELRRFGRKAGVPREILADDYKLHSAFVGIVGERSGTARVLNKYLDKKYRDALRRFADAGNGEELRRLWREALSSGEIAAAYWALLTHPATSETLFLESYGQVHMLSHLSGASVRVDMQQLETLKTRVPELERSLQQLRNESLRSQQAGKREIAKLRRELQEKERLRQEVSELSRELARLAEGHELQKLRGRIQELENQLARAQGRLEQADAEAYKWKILAGSWRDQCQQKKQAVARAAQERDALEQMLERLLKPDCDSCENAGSCSRDLDLCNRCILFVGGRNRQCAHFKALVERGNGRFVHHDGGLEQSRHRLAALLARADAVFCPLDCISHDAVNRIKRDCKRQGKPLMLLPRASLAAFARGLHDVVSGQQ